MIFSHITKIAAFPQNKRKQLHPDRSHMKDMLRGETLATGLPSSQQLQKRGPGHNTPAFSQETREIRSKRPRELQLVAELRKNADVIRQKHNNVFYGIINRHCVLPGSLMQVFYRATSKITCSIIQRNRETVLQIAIFPNRKKRCTLSP